MNHIFKNLNFGGLVALALGAVLMVSWTNSERKHQPTWYQITLINPTAPDDEDNQQIVQEYPTGTPSGDCNNNPGTTCAVLFEEELDPDLLPMTVSKADSLGFTVADKRQRQD